MNIIHIQFAFTKTTKAMSIVIDSGGQYSSSNVYFKDNF